MSSTRLLLAIAGLALAALPGCDKPGPAVKKAVSTGSVKIVKLSPETTTPLKVGDKVKIHVEVDYRLAADSGTLSLVVQSADNRSLGHDMEVVRNGAGKASLAVELVVPQTKAIQIFTPLQAQGQSATATVDFRAYKVTD